jgi:hypothetical protein
MTNTAFQDRARQCVENYNEDVGPINIFMSAWNPQTSTVLQQQLFIEPCRRDSVRNVQPTFLLIFRNLSWLAYFWPPLDVHCGLPR